MMNSDVGSPFATGSTTTTTSSLRRASGWSRSPPTAPPSLSFSSVPFSSKAFATIPNGLFSFTTTSSTSHNKDVSVISLIEHALAIVEQFDEDGSNEHETQPHSCSLQSQSQQQQWDQGQQGHVYAVQGRGRRRGRVQDRRDSMSSAGSSVQHVLVSDELSNRD